MRKTTTMGLAAVALFALVLGACGSSDGSDGADSGSGGNDAAPSLDGTQWLLTAMEPAVDGTATVAVTAQFAAGVMSGHSGCNTYRTSYQQDGVELTISEDIATTRVACPEGPSRVEQGYLTRLTRVATLTASGSNLTLRAADETPILQYRKAPTAEDLTGNWKATSFSTGTALVSPIVGTDLTAAFTADAVSGNGGCNSFNGGVKVDGTKITIGPLASTMKACADPAVDAQEQQYLHALELAETFEVAGDRLSLFRDDGGYAVTFERA
jgi:heat shock protein HslJ